MAFDFFVQKLQLQPATIQVPLAPLWQRSLTLVILCGYPFIASHLFPFGPTGRPLWVVLATLVPLVYLLRFGTEARVALLQDVKRWLLPWLPLILAYAIVVMWHGRIFGFVSVLTSRLLYAALIYSCARLIGITHRHLWAAAVIGCFLYAIAGVMDYYSYTLQWPVTSQLNRYFAESGAYRVGVGGNPITFGSFTIWMLGIVLVGLLQLKATDKRDIIVGLSAALMAFLVCLMTQSRGPLLGLVPLMGIGFFFIRPGYRLAAVAVPVFAGALIISLFHLYDPGNRFDRVLSDIALYVSQGKSSFTTVGARLEMWEMVGEGLSLSPWIGPGVASVADLSKQLPGGASSFGDVLAQRHFHNDVMQSLAIGGLLLLAGHIATLVCLIRNARHNASLLWLVLAALAFGLTDRVIHENNLFTFLVVTWALFCASFDNERTKRNDA
jgi:O-Antigen ligase